MFRQPLYTLLLMLLIAAASFGLVTRSVEYIAIRDRIHSISGFFHNVGILSHRDGITADVSEAMAYLANHPDVAFYDRRRGFEGTLTDMLNVYVEGSLYWLASWAYRYFPDEFEVSEYIALLPRLKPIEGFAGFGSGDSFFYGTVTDIDYVYMDFTRAFYPHKIIYVEVDAVLQGYPQRVSEGQTVRLRMDFPYGWQNSPLADIEIGQRYFFIGTFYYMLQNMQLDSRTITKFIQPIGDVWYVPVAEGEEVDTAALGICEWLKFARHAQSAVYLRTTRDMSAMPYAQTYLDKVTLWDGRFIDYYDYLEARPVVVIQRRFAERQRIRVGDTISINVNADQHLVYSPYYIVGNPDSVPTPLRVTIYPELGILSTPGAYPYITLELEVVGIFDLFRHRLVGTHWSSLNKFMFVPDSIIPADWNLQSTYFGDVGPDYTPALWYSFVLNDPRDQVDFLWNTRESLAAMGFRTDFLGRDGSGFWNVADTIMLSTTLNLIIFAVVTALVLALAAFLYLKQRTKEFVILRSLGCPTSKVIVQSTLAISLFSLPAIFGGAIAGWFYSNQLIEDVVIGFGEIIASTIGRHFLPSEREAILEYYTQATMPSIYWLAAFCAIIFTAILIFVLLGNLLMSKKSVLRMLQGGGL